MRPKLQKQSTLKFAGRIIPRAKLSGISDPNFKSIAHRSLQVELSRVSGGQHARGLGKYFNRIDYLIHFSDTCQRKNKINDFFFQFLSPFEGKRISCWMRQDYLKDV